MRNQITNNKEQITKKNWGFTLIELLVVISIMTILITLGITSFTSAQRKGRDAKRKSDLRETKNALEQYYSVCGFVYPTIEAGINSYDQIICWSPITIGILETVLRDPRTGVPYYCPAVVSDNCTVNGYSICANMEAETSPYCVTSSQ